MMGPPIEKNTRNHLCSTAKCGWHTKQQAWQHEARLLVFVTKEQEIDIMALTELNMAWDCLEYKDRLLAKHVDGGKQTIGV